MIMHCNSPMSICNLKYYFIIISLDTIDWQGIWRLGNNGKRKDREYLDGENKIRPNKKRSRGMGKMNGRK